MRFLILAAFLVISHSAFSQELKATVRITTPKLQTADPRVFETLEKDISDFLNGTRFSEDDWEDSERIECNFQINIVDEINISTFRADIAIQSVRPVYGTDYKTAVITHVDKDVLITYEQFQPIQDSRNNFVDNLSSVLTFYAYIILGYDYDTFELLGGSNHFRTAQAIINTIPPGVASQDKGWSSLNNKNNRYWIVENMLSPKIRPYREAMYQYHRLGLDMMATDVVQGQQEMMAALQKVDQVRSDYPNTIALRMFANAKSDEIIEIMKGANRSIKGAVMQIMRKVDIANASKYNALRS